MDISMAAHALIPLATAAASSVCARLTRYDRNYWPMLRVIFATFGFVYGGAAIAALMGGQGSASTRVVFSSVVLLALLYAIWFMRKRNATPRYIWIDVDGTQRTVGMGEIERAATLVESAANHGHLPGARAARLELALVEWRRKEAWRRGLRDDLAARQAERLADPGESGRERGID